MSTETASSPSRTAEKIVRYPGLDALRGVAALAVMFYHFRTIHAPGRNALDMPLFQSGYLAVDLFFVLSGFVVAHAYEARLRSSLTFREFLLIRFVRLQPVLAIGTIMGFALAIALRVSGAPGAYGLFAIATSLLPNLLLLPNPLVPWGIFLFNPPAWSLFYEMAANAVYALGLRRIREGGRPGADRHIAWTLLATTLAGAAGLVLSVVTYANLDKGVVLADWPVAAARIAFSFPLGALLYRTRSSWWAYVPSVPLYLPLATCFLALAPALPGPARAVYDIAFVMAASPVLVMITARTMAPKSATGASLWLGAISYPLYAVHAPIKHVLETTLRIEAPALFAIATVVTLVLAWVIAIRIEPPMRERLGPWLGLERRRDTAARADHTKGHVLFVSRQRISGRTNGSSAYLLDLAAAVRASGFTPHLLQPSPSLLGRWPWLRLAPEMKVFETHSIRGVLRVGSWVISRDARVGIDAVCGMLFRLGRRAGMTAMWLADRPRPYAIAMPWTAPDRDFVRRKSTGRDDIVIADYAFQTEAFSILPDRPSAIVMHDLFHSRANANGRDSVVAIDRDSEIALLSRADAIIAIQASEAEFVATNIRAARPILAPMAVRPVSAPQPGMARQLLFVGSNTAPNVEGLKWLFEHVWPSIQRKSPATKLDIVGSVATSFPAGGPKGVKFHGLVKDLGPYYAQCGVVISPLPFGSGLKIKLVEALAQGKAMVVTSVTLQGVERECGEAVIEADDPQSFASAILRLEDDARRVALAQAALAAARRHFTPSSCHAEFAAWLDANGPRSAQRKDRHVER